jgi:large subunit ribosomal protein L17
MPKPKKGPRLGSGPAHQKLMLSGLASSLIRDGKVKTTEARAKAVRPVVERLITHAKRGDLAARRRVLRTVPDRDIVHKLFSEVAPQYAERNGGYTRIVKLGPRKGDAAPMALVELIEGTGEEE